MNLISTIWVSPDTAEVLFLVAAITAGILAVLEAMRGDVGALLPGAVCLLCLGLLAL